VLTRAVPVTSGAKCFTPTVIYNFLENLVGYAIQHERLRVPYRHFVDSSDISSFLTFHETLKVVLNWTLSESNKAMIVGKSSLDTLLAKCLAASRQLAHEIESNTITLHSVRAVLRKPRETVNLIQMSTKQYHITITELSAIGRMIKKFDNRFEAVQYFLLNYCNNGDPNVYIVPTNMAFLRNGVHDVSQKLSDDVYMLKALQTQLPEIAAVVERFPDVDLLYSLRSSNIFRNLLWQKNWHRYSAMAFTTCCFPVA
jgi:hypothetical protein